MQRPDAGRCRVGSDAVNRHRDGSDRRRVEAVTLRRFHADTRDTSASLDQVERPAPRRLERDGTVLFQLKNDAKSGEGRVDRNLDRAVRVLRNSPPSGGYRLGSGTHTGEKPGKLSRVGCTQVGPRCRIVRDRGLPHSLVPSPVPSAIARSCCWSVSLTTLFSGRTERAQ